MGIIKCCVGGCNANSETNRLFCFPKNEYLRKLWMSFLVPTNTLLRELSMDKLQKKRVCERHFDPHQFDGEGRRLRYAYPCLFTETEIALRVPLAAAGWDGESEHNYCKKQDDDGDVSKSLVVIGEPAMDSINEEVAGDSSDSSDSSSSSDSPETASSLSEQQPHSPKRRKKKACSSKIKSIRRRTDDALARLAAQVSSFNDYISGVALQPTTNSSVYLPEYQPDCQSDVSADVSGELYSENEVPPSDDPLSFELKTVLKEPSIPKSLPAHVELLKSVQHFETEDWDSVRYADVQKQYCSAPGFNSLETNDEFKPYEKSNSLALIERGFAAITQAIIKHNEASEAGFKSLIEWAGSTQNLSPKTLQEKINEVFVKGSFQKTSGDILQLSCGHRAEIIQKRRDSVLRSVKDSFVKASLRKIPPSCDNLFQKEVLCSTIEKVGGTGKIFWPPRTPTLNKTAVQAQQQQQVQALPSYANKYVDKIPAQGMCKYPQFEDVENRLPPQGAPSNNSLPMQGRDYPRPSKQFTQNTRPSRSKSNRNFQKYDAYPSTSRGRVRFSRLSLPRMQSKSKL